MSTTVLESPGSTRAGSIPPAVRWVLIAFLVYLLLVAVAMIGSGFKLSA